MCEWMTNAQKTECNCFTSCCIYKAQELQSVEKLEALRKELETLHSKSTA
jgi:hypothetical protein